MRLKAKQLTLGIKIVNKLDYEAKILETKKKRHLITPDYNRFMNNILDANVTEKGISKLF